MSEARNEPDAAERDSPKPDRREAGRAIEWLLISTVGLTVLSLAAAHAPGHVRLLGLFGIGFGLLAGAGLGRLAKAMELKPTAFPAVMTFLLIAAGGCGVIWESRRIYAAELLKQYSRNIVHHETQRKNGPVVLGGVGSWDSASETIPDAVRRKWEEETRLPAYLKWRMSNSPLRDTPVGWAVAIAFAEWVCGALAGTWLFVLTFRRGQFATAKTETDD